MKTPLIYSVTDTIQTDVILLPGSDDKITHEELKFDFHFHTLPTEGNQGAFHVEVKVLLLNRSNQPVITSGVTTKFNWRTENIRKLNAEESIDQFIEMVSVSVSHLRDWLHSNMKDFKDPFILPFYSNVKLKEFTGTEIMKWISRSMPVEQLTK